MREAGIIKWFGGFNPRINKLNDFGYILRDNQPDLYVNRNHLHCKAKLLFPGIAVSFEVGVNYKNNMEQALKVRLLKNENEEMLVKKCVFSNKKQYYMPLIGKFLKDAESSNISLVLPKILSLDKDEKKKVMESIDLELKQREDIFKLLDMEEKINVLFSLEENKLIMMWSNLELRVKIFFLYRLCSENRDISIVERITEKNLFMRAMLIILWVRYNQDKKEIAYKKACEFIFKYSADIGQEDTTYKELKLIFPTGNDFKVDVNKQWMNWSILEFIQYCNCTNILEDINRGNKTVIMLVSSINSFIKRFNM
ncbi:hypothetical protein [Clostridium arbusti]|uniref:hypothetical protein n=1 Tax=Clostridium arbusti TaxID=1137848 RepID=UPI000288EFAD|nr:hypothetical protein [Clostridium arbusti]